MTGRFLTEAEHTALWNERPAPRPRAPKRVKRSAIDRCRVEHPAGVSLIEAQRLSHAPVRIAKRRHARRLLSFTTSAPASPST
jgi:hypothetical protein